MDNKTETKKNRSTPALKVLKRASKSYEALQQGLILALLNTQNYTLVIKKPERRSVKTIQSLIVKSIIFPNGYQFDFEIELENHCNKLAEDELKEAKYYSLTAENIESLAEINKIIKDGYDLEKLKQIKRHRDANRNSIAFNWIVEYAENLGYKFGKRSSKPAQFTTKMVKITSVLGKDDTIDMNQDVIEYIGVKFNNHLFELFETVENEVVLNGNDEFIYNLVHNHEEVKGTFLKSLYEDELNEANDINENTLQLLQNNTIVTSNENQMKKENKEMECEDEDEESNIQSKSITVTQCHENVIDLTQNENNNLNQSIHESNMQNDNEMKLEMSNDIRQLPEIEIQPNEMENQTVTSQADDCSIDDELYQQIKEYYENMIYDDMCCNSFIQCYNF